MRVVVGEGRRAPVAASIVVCLSLLVMAWTLSTGQPSRALVAGSVVAIGVVVLARPLTRWQTMLSILVLCIIFIPIRRYTMGGVGFQLEPYRIVAALLIFAWVTSLLIDPRVKARKSGLGAPLLLLLLAVVASDLVNLQTARTQLVTSNMVKTDTFFLSWIFVFLIIVSLVRTEEARERLLRLLVGSTAVLACFAVYETRAQYNVFDHLNSFIPLLKPYVLTVSPVDIREGKWRSYASAEVPIALGALFALVLPFGFYLLKKTKERRWIFAIAALVAGTVSTVSRTAAIMLAVIAIVYLILRFRDVKRFWPAIIPLLLVIHFAVPGTISVLFSSFHPQGGLVAEQSATANDHARRLYRATIALREIGPDPFLGLGFGTNVSTGPDANVPILDDQWLGNLVDAGIIGTLAWVWLFARFIRRTGREARRDDSDRSWLMTAYCASITAFAVGMFTYDAFSFIQEAIVMFILLGLGCSALLDQPQPETSPAVERQPVRGALPAAPAA
jgi:polysaccharide biosynthesis protein PslJ